MKKLIVAILTTLFAVNMAFAADASCESKAAEKKLAGAAKASFMKKCEADAKMAGGDKCAAQAAEKKLAGAAKASFMKKCEAGGAKAPDATAACESKAAEKKLAGAAKASFMKKCTSEASPGM